jgi:hypothetical protein
LKEATVDQMRQQSVEVDVTLSDVGFNLFKLTKHKALSFYVKIDFNLLYIL